jgi:hypothetical protein
VKTNLEKTFILKGDIMLNKKLINHKLVTFCFIFIFLSMTGCIGNNGDKILIVEISKEEVGLSEQAVIKESLEKGGSITINVDLARKIDENFDEKYAVFNSAETFFTRPALLNFIGDNGWNFKQGGLGSYIFTQSR